MGYSYGTKWTDEKIEQSILNVVDKLELKRMPTRSECISFYGNYKLTSKISKISGGWYGLAQKLHLNIKDSETTTGKSYELLVAKELINMGFSVEKMPQNFPYDLLINNYIKVDVKASYLYKGSSGNFYSFRIGKPYATCDVYILVCLNEDKSINKLYIVPSPVVMQNKQISIGEKKSKYDKYIDNYKLLNSYSDFFNKWN